MYNCSKIRIFFLFTFLYILLVFENKQRNEFIMKETLPKVSIFLPIYNKKDYLARSIGSIQNQSLKNIEIIAVNDASTDESLNLLKRLAKKDNRIKIVNNDRNHGLLYSRSMGIINSTGEYLMNLDPDDKLQGDDNLEILYNKSKISNADVVRFLIKRIPLNNFEKKQYDIINSNQLKNNDNLISNKFVKKENFLKAYEIFKTKIYSNKWNYHEDNIWNILIRKNSLFLLGLNFFKKKGEIILILIRKILNSFIFIEEIMHL